MKPLSRFGYFKLSRFSRPACDRRIYQLIRQHRCHRIVEVGLADGLRAAHLIAVAQRFSEEPVRYTGIDLFEARTTGQPLSLKDMHRRLRPTEARVQLVPGDFASALPRIANAHAETDLLLISAGTTAEGEAAWAFVPRMLHEGSLVLRQPEVDGGFERVRPEQLPSAVPKRSAA